MMNLLLTSMLVLSSHRYPHRHNRRPRLLQDVVASEAAGSTSHECAQYNISVAAPLSAGGRRVLVTGGAGFIGSHVARGAAALGMRVTIVDDLSGGYLRNLPPNVEFIQGDVKDAKFVDSLFFGTAGGGRNNSLRRFDYVYHLAAYAAEGLSHFIRSYNYRNNLVASTLLINAAVRSKVSCFVFTSSIAVYGAGQVPMTEETRPVPEDPYGISKYAVELDLEAAHRMFGLNYIIARPHNVYGPGQNAEDKYRNVVGIFLQQLRAGKPLSIFGDGSQTRSFTYVKDVADVLSRAPLHREAYNQVFNVGAETAYSINELATQIADQWNVGLGASERTKVVHLDARKEVQNAVSAHTKQRCYFGLTAPVPLKQGLEKTVAWAKAFFQEVPKQREFDAVEVMRAMPPSWRRPQMVEVPEVQHAGPDRAAHAPTPEELQR